jgi:WD40 repeat protein
MFAAQAAAQETRVAAAAAADVIALYSPHVEKRLLRAHFDRAAAKVSLAPFGPPGVENFAVAPNGAFIVYSATREQVAANPVTYLFLLDETGHVLGEPLRSPIGAITGLAVSPKGDRIAAGNDRGWMALLTIQGTGPARRLALRTEFGVKADRQFTFAFRPDGGLVTLVDDWVATYRSNDGAIQRTLDLKTINRDLSPADQDTGGLFQLRWSPRGDRFAVSWGAGPMITTIFDSGGRSLRSPVAEDGFNFWASKAEFVDGGDAMILCGMKGRPELVRMKSLAPTNLGDPDTTVMGCAPLAGGREIAFLAADDQIALWSLDGKRLTKPVGLENYSLGAAVAGAKDEVIVAAERGGWIDLYTKQGKFMRRVQSGARGRPGSVALSADGATLAALGSDVLGVIALQPGRAWAAPASETGPLVAMASNGSRIVTEGPDKTLRSWSRDGSGLDSIPLKADGQVPGGRWFSDLAVSTNGDAIAAVEEGSAVWLANPADKSVLRVALAARSVAPLPDGSGFAVGLADGTVVRISADGTVRGPPVKASERGAVDTIVVAPDGQSLIAVAGEERRARHLAWDGKVLAGTYRPGWTIEDAFFFEGSPRLIVKYVVSAADERFAVETLAPPGESQSTSLEPPR